eukprot:4311654-Prymnesium_polylepis.1
MEPLVVLERSQVGRLVLVRERPCAQTRDGRTHFPSAESHACSPLTITERRGTEGSVRVDEAVPGGGTDAPGCHPVRSGRSPC